MARRISRSTVIAAPPAIVWDALVDTRRWADWGPSVRSVECDPPVISAGTTGRVRTVLGVSLPFEVTRFEAQRSWSWRVAGIPATGHRIEAVGSATRVVFDVPWIAAPYVAVLAVGLGRLRRLVEGREP